MNDHIPIPTVKNKLLVAKYNFTLIVLAYRSLAGHELRTAYYTYLSTHGLKHPPRNKVVTVLATHDNNL